MSSFEDEDSCNSDKDVSFYSSMDDIASPDRSQAHLKAEDVLVVSESEDEKVDNRVAVERIVSHNDSRHRERAARSDSFMHDTSAEQSWAEHKSDKIVIDSESDQEDADNVVHVRRLSKFREDSQGAKRNARSDSWMGDSSAEQSWVDRKTKRIVIHSESDEEESASHCYDDSHSSKKSHTYSPVNNSSSSEKSWAESKSENIAIDSESDLEEANNVVETQRTPQFHALSSGNKKARIYSPANNSTPSEMRLAKSKSEKIVIDSEGDEKEADNVADIERTPYFHAASNNSKKSRIYSPANISATSEKSWSESKSEKIVIDSESDEKEGDNIVDIEKTPHFHAALNNSKKTRIYSPADDSTTSEKSWAESKSENIVIDSDSDVEEVNKVADVERTPHYRAVSNLSKKARIYSPVNNSTTSEQSWSNLEGESIMIGSESDDEKVDDRLDIRRTLNFHREDFRGSEKDERLYSSMGHNATVEQSWEHFKPVNSGIVAENYTKKLETLPKCLLSEPVTTQKAENPKGLKTQLMPHQQEALFWLNWRERQKPPGGVLADDMGLGKTLTMISLIVASKERNDFSDDSDTENKDDSNWNTDFKGRGVKGHTLVICPASLLVQWENEIKNRCKKGVLTSKLYHGSNREKVPWQLGKFDVVITTYNIAAYEFKNLSTLFKVKWERVILDEAHIIRNHKTQVSQAVCGLSTSKRWALTGTPIHNKELDLYSILKFLKCSPFDDLRVWKRWVEDKNTNVGRNRLATVMKSLMLRRTKQELQEKGVLSALPEKVVKEVYVHLDGQEQLVYEKVLIFSRTLFAQFLSQRVEKEQMANLDPNYYRKNKFLGRPTDTQFTKAQNELLSLHADVKTHEILVLLLRLRQICCHPSLIHGMLDQEDVEDTDAIDNENVDSDLLLRMNSISLLESNNEENISEKEIGVDSRVRTNILTSKNPVFDSDRLSSKVKAIFRVTEEILEKGDKLVIVSEWATMLNIIASCLHTIENATFAKLTGSVPVKDRQAIIDTFNAEDDTLRILLLSLTAGGVGLNLVGANHLLLVDVHWNPQLESQAQDRIYRFGQKKNVSVYKFICKNTIEERVKQLQEHKLEIANSILSGVKETVKKLTLNDLKSLFSM